MGYKLSAVQWADLKLKFPDNIQAIPVIVLDMESAIWNNRYNTIFSRTKAKINTKVLDFVKWCDDTLEGQYYLETLQYKDFLIFGDPNTKIKCYFLLDSDAVLVKLTWWNPNYT